MAEPSAQAMEPEATRRQLVRAVVASTVGTSIEWYDFFLYGFVAALVFGKLFFPNSDPYTGTLLAFATYFGGFAARPVGAFIFGHYGDRIGRKTTLIVTLVFMGVATFLIGLVPTYASIGIWGGIILTILRAMQGIGVGGEWGGSVLLSMEWGHRSKRGFIASWAQFGVPVGLVLSVGALNFFNAIAGKQGFLDWGWRVPFLLSIVLFAVGLYIRLGIFETPIFARILEQRRIEPQPAVEVIRRNWKEILLSALIRTGQQTPFYIFVTFVLTYATVNLKFKRGDILNDVLVASVVSLFTIPLWSYVSDLIGRKRMYVIGAVAMLVFAYPYFALLDTRVPALVFLAIVLSLPVHDMQYGPQAAFIAEAFTGRLRYSGASLGYHLASVTAGGPAPLVALWLFQTYRTSAAIAVYIMLTAVVSIVSAALLRDRGRDDISEEYDRVSAPAPA